MNIYCLKDFKIIFYSNAPEDLNDSMEFDQKEVTDEDFNDKFSTKISVAT